MPLISTGPAVTSTCAATVAKYWLVVVDKPLAGTEMIAWEELPTAIPLRVKGVKVVTCSEYIPGHTAMVEPGGTAFTGTWMAPKAPTLEVPT